MLLDEQSSRVRRIAMNDKLNVKQSAKDGRIRNNQRGALLIGLIITMVIISALSGAMVYIFSSSTLNPVTGKYAQQAYYNAEAGFRYLTSVYRNEATPNDGRTAIQHYETTTSEANRTITLPGGGTALITMSSLGGAYSPATATATLSGSDLVLSGVSGTFPAAPGFFSISSGPTVYRYTVKSTDGSGIITLSGITPSGYTTGPIETREQTTITSVGTFGGGSFFNINRKITYVWVLSGFPSGASPVPPPLPIAPADMRVDTGAMQFEEVTAPPDPTGKALWVKSDQGGGAITEAYVVPPSSVYATNTNLNPFKIMWNNAGGYSTYDLQVKIATNGTGAVIMGDEGYETMGWDDSLRPDTYANGLAFRAIPDASLNQYGFLGLSLMRSHIEGLTDGIVDNMVPPTSVPTGVVPWEKNGTYVIGDRVQTDNYYECIKPHTDVKGNTQPLIDIDPTDPAPTWTEYWKDITPPMIVLWRRDRNAANGDDRWLAFSLLDQNGTDYIVDSALRVKDWSTLLVRVVEAASLEFSGTVSAQVEDIVKGGTSLATGKVIKKIKNAAGTHDILLLNNLTGTFSTSETISLLSGTSLGDATFRSRDNYIWAMFGDKDDHPDTDYSIAMDGIRHDNVRLTDEQSVDPVEVAKRIHWPEYNIQDDWGNVLSDLPSPFNVENDYFKLVQWHNSLNTALDSTLVILGSGKEQNAIIRTSNPEWFRVGPYTDLNYPPEIGLAALGSTSQKTFFDDFIYRFPYIPPGGVAYVSPVQQ